MTERQPTDDDALANDLIVTSARLVRLVRYRADVDDSTATWRALSILAERGPLRVSDFAAIDRLSQPSATAILRRLREDTENRLQTLLRATGTEPPPVLHARSSGAWQRRHQAFERLHG